MSEIDVNIDKLKMNPEEHKGLTLRFNPMKIRPSPIPRFLSKVTSLAIDLKQIHSS